jgi:hypothetical protein
VQVDDFEQLRTPFLSREQTVVSRAKRARPGYDRC